METIDIIIKAIIVIIAVAISVAIVYLLRSFLNEIWQLANFKW